MLKKIPPSEIISYSLFLILPALLPFVRRAAPPFLVLVGAYAGFILWREARLAALIKARLRQPTTWLFLAFMLWAALSLLWTPVPVRGLQSVASGLLLVICALLIFEFPLSKNASRLLVIGLSIGSTVIALDLVTNSHLLHAFHTRPEPYRYNMVVVTFVVLVSALMRQSARIKPTLLLVTLICLIAAVFRSESETAKLALLLMPFVFLTARLMRLEHDGPVIFVGLAGLWLFAAFGMQSLAHIKSLLPSDFWTHGAADERVAVWRGFSALALAGLPLGWGLESTSAPEATSFLSSTSEAIKAGIVGRLHSHNNILQIAAELGVPGLVLAFALNSKMIWETASSSLSHRAWFLVFLATVTSIGLISHGLWQSWWWAAILVGAYFLYGSETNELNAKPRRKEINKLASSPLLQATLATLLAFIVAQILRSGIFDPNENTELLAKNLLMGFAAGFVASRFMLFVVRSSVTGAYGFGIPITVIVFSLLAAMIALFRIDFLRLELLLHFFFSTFIITGFSFLLEKQRSFRFHCLSEQSLENFSALGNVSVTRLPPGRILGSLESDGIIVDFVKNLTSEQKKVLALSALNGVRTFDETEIFEKLAGSIPAEHVAQIAKVTPDTLGIYHHIKRVLDLVAALCLMPFFLVIIIGAAFAIKIDDGGAVFFRQARIGYKGKKFRVWKLRTMREGNPQCGSHYTLENDERITRVGKVLRRLRIDEFPQIIHVLNGQMSWIGPRPESAPLAEWYGDEIDLYDFRHLVRPGITGWAAVRQGNVGAVDAAKQKLYYDFFYIKNYSIELDLLIALKTMKIIFSGFGAR